ncbi:MAG: glutamine synthetase family protein [Thermomicrobiales bacterium]
MVATVDRMRAAAEKALTQAKDAGVRLVDLRFSDITGGAKTLTIPVELLHSTLAHGYRFDGSALTGLRKVELDLYLMPDPSTLVIFPHAEQGERRAQLSCSVLRRDGNPFAGDPRSVLERTLETARAAGYHYRVGIEIEFYLLSTDLAAQGPSGGAGYFDLGEDRVAATRDEILTTLQGMGIGVGGAHHETGPGQEELDLPATDALRMADQLIIVRQVVRSVAQRHGLRATFMPKPFTDAPGSGMHVFQELARDADGGDALRGGDDDISTVARGLIGGQLAHAPGMCLVTNPSVNSYKRLNAGHRAPRHATWARVSQASLIRVPSWAPGEEAAIELRSPDAMANPYLAFAVALACGLDGIKHNEEPSDPLDESFVVYDDGELQRLGIPRLPGTMGEALAPFTQDPVIQSSLGDYVFDQLLTVKKAEWEDYRRHVSPWELARYGDA